MNERIMNYNKAVFFFFFLIFLACSLLAQEINLTNSSANSEWPAIAVNSNGKIMVVWSEWGNPAPMWYRIYDNGWSSPRNSNIVHEQAWSNKLDVDSNGTFHISYADGYGSRGRDIWYSYYTGTSWATAERIYRSAHNSAWNWMSIDNNDDIHIIWYHKYLDSPNVSDVVTMRKKVGGSWPHSYDNVSRRASSESIHPAVRVRNENIYAVYMDGGLGNRRLTFAEKLGGSWSSPIELASTGYYPAIDLDSSGNVHIVFTNWSGNFYAVSRVSGNWESVKVISNGNAPLQFGDIRYRNGVLVAVFTQKSNNQWYVYYTVKFGNNSWSMPIRLSSGDNFGDGNKHTQVILDHQGYAHFLWEGAGVGGNADIFYTKVKLAEPDFPFIEVDRYYLDFKTVEGDKPGQQSFGIRNSGKGTFYYQITTNRDWLGVSPQQETATDDWESIVVDVDPGNRGPGTYNGTITIKSDEASNSPVNINVNLTIEKRKVPHIQLNKSSLYYFAYVKWGDPESQNFQIRNSGDLTLDYQVSANRNWIKISPKYGKSSGEWDTINVSIDTSSMNFGKFTGQIKISDPSADNNPQTITVTLQLDKPPIPFAPESVTLTKYSHEALFFKVYKNKVSWQANPDNDGLFNITKYIIFRRLKEGGSYISIGDVSSSVFSIFDEDFSTPEDRDKYYYAVACVDEDNKESNKTDASDGSQSPALLIWNQKKNTEKKRP